MNKKTRYYAEIIVASAVAATAGIALWFGYLQSLYLNGISAIPLIGILFATVAFLFVGVGGLIEFVSRRVWPLKKSLSIKRFLLTLLIGTMLAGTGSATLEWIYELQPTDISREPATEVVFVVDDSGSMMRSDRGYQRLSSIKEILKEADARTSVGLVRFSSDVTCSVSPQPCTTDQKRIIEANLHEVSDGDTEMNTALHHAIQLFGNESTKKKAIVLLTDGNASSPVNEAKVIQMCKNKGITINSIALGHSADKLFLERISSKTGGQVATVLDPMYLKAVYSMLMHTKVFRRCLLTPIFVSSQETENRVSMQAGFLFLIALVIQGLLFSLLYHKPFGSLQPWVVIPLLVTAFGIANANATESAIVCYFISAVVPLYQCRNVYVPRKRRSAAKRARKIPTKKMRVGIYRDDTPSVGLTACRSYNRITGYRFLRSYSETGRRIRYHD